MAGRLETMAGHYQVVDTPEGVEVYFFFAGSTSGHRVIEEEGKFYLHGDFLLSEEDSVALAKLLRPAKTWADEIREAALLDSTKWRLIATDTEKGIQVWYRLTGKDKFSWCVKRGSQHLTSLNLEDILKKAMEGGNYVFFANEVLAVDNLVTYLYGELKGPSSIEDLEKNYTKVSIRATSLGKAYLEAEEDESFPRGLVPGDVILMNGYYCLVESEGYRKLKLS